MFKSDPFSSILEYLRNARRVRNSVLYNCNLPEETDVQEIVETCYLASIRQEEGRPIRCTVVICNASDIRNSRNSRNQIYEFDNVLEFNSETISKISPAYDQQTSFLCVTRNRETAALEIWGVWYSIAWPDRFGPDENSEKPQRPDFFSVGIDGPGSLAFSMHGWFIGRFTEGRYIRPLMDPYHSSQLGGLLLKYIAEDSLFLRYKNQYWHRYRDILRNVLSEASQGGHGAAIILLPFFYDDDCSELIELRYKFATKLGIKDLIEELLELEFVPSTHRPSQDPTDAEKLKAFLNYSKQQRKRREIVDRIGLIAQLSSVDGALVLTQDLDVVGYGALLRGTKWTEKITLSGYGGKCQFFDARKYGSRHNSAINFVGQCPDATAFVISQDGPVRAFTKSSEHEITCWQDCDQPSLM